VLLEDPDIQGRIRSDRVHSSKSCVLLSYSTKFKCSELLSYVRTLVDARPAGWGSAIHWIAGSPADAGHHRIDGRPGRHSAALPFSVAETPKVNVLHGGFPEVLARPKSEHCGSLLISKTTWSATSEQLRTYVTCDVSSVSALLASRHGQILNKTDLAAPSEFPSRLSVSGYIFSR